MIALGVLLPPAPSPLTLRYQVLTMAEGPRGVAYSFPFLPTGQNN